MVSGARLRMDQDANPVGEGVETLCMTEVGYLKILISHAWARFISPAWSVELTWPLPIIRISSYCHEISTKKSVM